MNMEAILALMNTTRAVMKLRFKSLTGLNILSFLSFPLIDFYKDSGWATLNQILKHILKTLNLDDHVYHP